MDQEIPQQPTEQRDLGDVASNTTTFRKVLKLGVDRSLDGQEHLVELTKKQSNLALEGLNAILGFRFSTFPREIVRLSGNAIENIVDTQSALLDLAQDYARETKEMVVSEESPKISTRFAEFFESQVDSAVDRQRSFLDSTRERTQSRVDSFATEEDEPAPEEETPEWLELARQGVNRFAESQQSTIEYSRLVTEKILA